MSQDEETFVILVGDFTFVEPSQNDYEELYYMYNVDQLDLVQNNPCFTIVHAVHESTTGTDKDINRIDKEGFSWLIPSQYSGYIIWLNQQNHG